MYDNRRRSPDHRERKPHLMDHFKRIRLGFPQLLWPKQPNVWFGSWRSRFPQRILSGLHDLRRNVSAGRVWPAINPGCSRGCIETLLSQVEAQLKPIILVTAIRQLKVQKGCNATFCNKWSIVDCSTSYVSIVSRPRHVKDPRMLANISEWVAMVSQTVQVVSKPNGHPNLCGDPSASHKSAEQNWNEVKRPRTASYQFWPAVAAIKGH